MRLEQKLVIATLCKTRVKKVMLLNVISNLGGQEFLRISSQYNITALTLNNLERYQLEIGRASCRERV